jgi:hypothetical protein
MRVGRNSFCPCASGKKAKRCCLLANGTLHKQQAQTRPGGPRTAYGHPRCYFGGDADCSTRISKEHFVSENLLQQIQFRGTAKVAGFRWQEPETFDVVSLKGLASKILCDRHNASLSPLDAEMGRLMETVKVFDQRTHPSKGDPSDCLALFSGDDIERWMLKCLMGAVESGNMRGKGSLPEECTALLLGRIEWPDRWGLYLNAREKALLYHSDSFVVQTLVRTDNGRIAATAFIMRGLPFYLLLGKPDNPGSFGYWRPIRIAFKQGNGSKVIEMSWSAPSDAQTVSLSRTGTYDGPPPDWLPWEKSG